MTGVQTCALPISPPKLSFSTSHTPYYPLQIYSRPSATTKRRESSKFLNFPFLSLLFAFTPDLSLHAILDLYPSSLKDVERPSLTPGASNT